MDMVFPDYYEDFKCLGGKCPHNCCIGWEIDIDPETAKFYRDLPGEIGERLRQNISWEEQPHFILGEKERCPFLNGKNLCDIILNLGEEHICGICTDHPRFRNRLPGRLETGLGLCCIEAARLILGKKETVSLVGAGESDDGIIAVRDEAIDILQDRRYSVAERAERLLRCCGAPRPHGDMKKWAEKLMSLERLEDSWTRCLELLRDTSPEQDAGFEEYMTGRETELEQFMVYLVYRHMANAEDEWGLAERAAFTVFAGELLHAMGNAIWKKTGKFSFEDMTELARLFSAEIEYSDENLDALFEEMLRA